MLLSEGIVQLCGLLESFNYAASPCCDVRLLTYGFVLPDAEKKGSLSRHFIRMILLSPNAYA